jgi:hypothetical protein
MAWRRWIPTSPVVPGPRGPWIVAVALHLVLTASDFLDIRGLEPSEYPVESLGQLGWSLPGLVLAGWAATWTALLYGHAWLRAWSVWGAFGFGAVCALLSTLWFIGVLHDLEALIAGVAVGRFSHWVSFQLLQMVMVLGVGLWLWGREGLLPEALKRVPAEGQELRGAQR